MGPDVLACRPFKNVYKLSGLRTESAHHTGDFLSRSNGREDGPDLGLVPLWRNTSTLELPTTCT